MDRKISVRATRDELIERGILLPDVASVGHSTSIATTMPIHVSRLPQHPNNFSLSEDPIYGKIDIKVHSKFSVMLVLLRYPLCGAFLANVINLDIKTTVNFYVCVPSIVR